MRRPVRTKVGRGVAHSPLPAFGSQELRKVLEENRLRVPPDEHLRWLCDGVVRLRQRLLPPRSHTIPELHDGSAAEAVDVLRRVIPRLRETIGGDLEKWQAGRVAEDKALSSLQSALFMAREYLAPPPAAQPRRVPWHEYAGTLAEAYVYAVRWAYPSVKLRFSNKGPVVRYVAAMVPYVGGMPSPTHAAVAQHLKRVRPRSAQAKATTKRGQTRRP